MHVFSLYLINFGDTVSVFFVYAYFLNFLLYVSCGSLIVYKCIHSIVVNLYRFFHLLTCSFKPLLFKGDLFSMAHPSIPPSPFKFLFSLAFGGSSHQHWLSLLLTVNIYFATGFILFLLFKCLVGKSLDGCLQLEPYFVVLLYNIWKECLCLLSLFLTSFNTVSHHYWIFPIIFSKQFPLMTHQ